MIEHVYNSVNHSVNQSAVLSVNLVRLNNFLLHSWGVQFIVPLDKISQSSRKVKTRAIFPSFSLFITIRYLNKPNNILTSICIWYGTHLFVLYGDEQYFKYKKCVLQTWKQVKKKLKKKHRYIYYPTLLGIPGRERFVIVPCRTKLKWKYDTVPHRS